MEHVKRPLTYRQRQALATQQLIMETARALFLEQGYGITTIEAIAATAGVAVSTVYAVYKNKRSILKAIREAWHLESGQRDIYQEALEETDARRRLALAAHATRRQWESGASMMLIYESAAAVDAEAAAELKEAEDGRRHSWNVHPADDEHASPWSASSAGKCGVSQPDAAGSVPRTRHGRGVVAGCV